jgi:cell division protein FtsL
MRARALCTSRNLASRTTNIKISFVETSVSALHEPPTEAESLRRRVAELETVVRAVTAERDKLRKDYELLRIEIALLQKRIFAARAERIDTKQLEMEFATKRGRATFMKPCDEPDEPVRGC